MDRDVLLSLLSLDSYNRGPNAGLALTGTTIAGANIIDHSGAGGGYSPGSSDFFAVTYEIDDNPGDLVIAYRGTDDLFNVDGDGNITGDIPSGWGQGIGLWTDQSSDAVLYYQHTAAAAGVGLFNSGIETTGHSLGGGLAGLVSSLYNLSSVVFNNEPYQLTAQNAFSAAQDVGTPAETPADVALKELIYGSGSLVAPTITNPTTISDVDDVLHLFRLTQTSAETDVPIGYNSLGFLDGHSAALVTVLTFANSESNTAWLDASQPLWDSFASSDVASHVSGLSAIIGTGNDSPTQAMMTTIAYSVVDPTMSTFDKPFGDTAVRAMFNDAADAAGVQSTISNFGYPEGHVLDAVVAYAGNLASHSIDSADSPSSLEGILRVGDDGTLTVDLSEDRWAFGSDHVDPAYKNDIITDVFYGDSNSQSLVTYAADWYSQENGLSLIGLDRLSYISFGADGASTQTPPPLDDNNLDLMVSGYGASGAAIDENDRAILLANGGITSLSGHSGTDMLIESYGAASLSSGAGNDLIIANGGENDITAGSGDDTVVLLGGAQQYHFSSGDGHDTIERLDDAELTIDLNSFNQADATIRWDFTPNGDWSQSGTYWPTEVFGSGDLAISFGGTDSVLIKNVSGIIWVTANDDGSPNLDFTHGFDYTLGITVDFADTDPVSDVDDITQDYYGQGSYLSVGDVSSFDHGLNTAGYFMI